MSRVALHLAILRAAAALVPEQQRPDWLAEWQSELWYVRRDTQGWKVAAFCFGAFKDAFCLWRDESCPDRLSVLWESPARCLLLLAAVGSLCLALVFLLPAA